MANEISRKISSIGALNHEQSDSISVKYIQNKIWVFTRYKSNKLVLDGHPNRCVEIIIEILL